MREKEESADRPAWVHRERHHDNGEAEPDAARDMERSPEGDEGVIHKPKLWTGTQDDSKPQTTRKKQTVPQALAEPAEKIPDEIEVIDQQHELDVGA